MYTPVDEYTFDGEYIFVVMEVINDETRNYINLETGEKSVFHSESRLNQYFKPIA